MVYTLMHKNIPVIDMEIQNDVAVISKMMQIYNEKRIPIGFFDNEGKIDIAKSNSWWKGRSIPASRLGIEETLDIMGLSVPEQLIIKCYGMSLSDQYWVCPQNVKLDWNKINFFDNDFSDDVGNALFGQEKASEEISLMSPDNTSDGWLKKKWKIIDGERCLLKSGSSPFFQEPFNEVLSSEIQKRLNCSPFVDYWLELDNEVPFSSMAPVFDCGTSMWYDQVTSNIIPIKLDESKPFKKNHHAQIELVGDLEWVNFDALKDISDICNDIYEKSPYIDDARRSNLCYAIDYRIDMLEKIALERIQKQGVGFEMV